MTDLSDLSQRDLLHYAYGQQDEIDSQQETINQLKAIVIGNNYLV